MTLTTKHVNYLNSGLMLLSAAAAFAFPFELFLFSYAVMGPRHYLTEISWLHDRNYFSGNQAAKRPKPNKFWLTAVAITMLVIFVSFVLVEGAGDQAQPRWEITCFYFVFVTAVFAGAVRHRAARIFLAAMALGLALVFVRSPYYVLGAFLLVTNIHVLIFTASFILYGALREQTFSGLLSLGVFVLCVITFFVYVPPGHLPGDFVKQSYRSFNALNAELMKLFRLGSGTTTAEIYDSRSGLMIMRLIAFSYTYHYLNWFSKTSIIKWHEVPRSRIVLIGFVWLAALAIYAYNYDTGMAVLYFMSILHVMLEFPLNHRTFAAIGRRLYALATSNRSAMVSD